MAINTYNINDISMDKKVLNWNYDNQFLTCLLVIDASKNGLECEIESGDVLPTSNTLS